MTARRVFPTGGVIWAGLRAILLAATLATACAAQPSEPRPVRMGDSGNFYVDWQSAEVSPPPGERSVAKGDYLFKQPLKPSGLAKPLADVLDVQGRVVIPAGTVLIRMERIWPIYCWFDAAKVAANAGQAACVSDMKAAGHFDRLFLHETDMTGVPQVRDKIPQNMVTIAAIKYETVPLENWDSPYFVGLKFKGGSLSGSGPLFAFVGGPGFDRQVMGASRIRKTEVPAETSVEGASMLISSWDETTLRADVRSGFQVKRWPEHPKRRTVMIYVPY